MKYEQLKPAIELLNNQFRNEVMLPNSLPIKEFIAGPENTNLMPDFILAYTQRGSMLNESLSNNKDLLRLLPKDISLVIYAVFVNGTTPEFLLCSQFLQANSIDPTLLAIQHIQQDKSKAEEIESDLDH